MRPVNRMLVVGALGALWLSGPSGVSAQQVVFDPFTEYVTGRGSTAVQTVDLNGNGHVDIASASRDDNAVSVFLNRGDGTFDPAVKYPVGAFPRSLAAADLNGNGHIDLVSADWDSDTISLLFNNGDGTFAPATQLPLAPRPTYVTAGDLNNNGIPDLAVAVLGTPGAVAVLHNDGTGKFTEAGRHPVGVEPRCIALGDFNNSGLLDMAIANRLSHNISILLQAEGGAFGPASHISAGFSPRYIAVGRLNRDENLDLAVAMFGQDQMWTFFGDGNGGFQAGGSYSAGVAPHGAVIADLTGDWNLDIAVANAGSPFVSVYLNDGEGGFGNSVQVASLSGPADVAVADLSEDGRPDLVLGYAGPRITVSLNRSPPPQRWVDVTTPELADPQGRGRGAAWGDYNNGGRLDLLVTNWDQGNRLFRNDGGDTFTEVTPEALQEVGFSGRAVFADMNNNGHLDIYIAQSLGSLLLRNNGDGTFTNIAPGQPPEMRGYLARGAAWADIDGNGLLDLYVSAIHGRDGQSKMFKNQGDDTFVDVTTGVLGDIGVGRGVAFADYDNDGWPDLYLANGLPGPAGGWPSLTTNRLFRNRGDGTFSSATTGPLSDTNHSRGIAWGDYNNNGLLDLYIANLRGDPLGGSDNKLLRNNGDGSFTDVTPPLLADATSTRDCAWVDFDNDGWLDLYIVNTTTANRLFRNMGGWFIEVDAGPLADPGNGNSGAWADYNGDGAMDVYICNNGPNRLVRNELNNDNNWLQVRLTGTVSNRSAIGARIRAVTDRHDQIREVQSGSGYLTQHMLTAHFGLGKAPVVQRLEIRWPSGIVQFLEDVQPNQTLDITEPDPGCYPDCDNNRRLDFFDFLCFQNAFLAGDPYADCDGDGKLDFFDFLCFQNEFLAGCP